MSPLFIVDRPCLLTAGIQVQEAAGSLVTMATIVILTGRLRRARSDQRRVLIQLFGPGMFVVLYIPITSSMLSRLFDPIVIESVRSLP